MFIFTADELRTVLVWSCAAVYMLGLVSGVWAYRLATGASRAAYMEKR